MEVSRDPALTIRRPAGEQVALPTGACKPASRWVKANRLHR